MESNFESEESGAEKPDITLGRGGVYSMRIKNKIMLSMVLWAAMSAFVLAGCGSAEREGNQKKGPETAVEATQEAGRAQEPVTTEGMEATEEVGFSFADVSNLEFWFASGAGGWCTELFIHEDGTFEGLYHDSDMGDTGEGYPNGIQYFCKFTGKFVQPKKVDDDTYSTRIERIEFENQPGTEENIDGVRYIYTEAYGLDEAEEILIYLPGIPLDKLPEAYRSWVGYYDLESTIDTTLPFYGIYNVVPECGFSSYEYEAAVGINEELAGIEETSAAMEKELQSANLTQIELNETSAELYKLWDDELNSIWSRLKETLDEDEMAELLTEQREWISYKESEVATVGEEYGEGTMRALVENDRAAELTKERVYELAELLR